MSSEIVGAGAEPEQDLEALRRLLASPNPKDDSWQSEAGKAAARVALLVGSSDETRALRSLSLVNLAQKAGVKEAKKRELKLTRWADTPPPSLHVLTSDMERSACIAQLSKLRATWSRDYVARSITDPDIALQLLPELLRWARSLYDASEFFQLFAMWVEASAVIDRLLVFLKEAHRLAGPATGSNAELSARQFSAIADAALAANRWHSDTKLSVSAIKGIFGVLHEYTGAAPAILLEVPVVSAIAKLRSQADSMSLTKTLAADFNATSTATHTLLKGEIGRYGGAALAHWRPAADLFERAFPDWGKISWSTEADGAQPPGATYEGEAIFGQLLPAWQAFVLDLPEPSKAKSIDEWLQSAAQREGVEYFGAIGEHVMFDPLRHDLVGGDGPSDQVEVRRRGVQIRRKDGSTRVLVKAIVASA